MASLNRSYVEPPLSDKECMTCGTLYTPDLLFQKRSLKDNILVPKNSEYDHIPPNEKCMALLLPEERFLKIKQVMREEHNQPEVMQELLLKLMDDLQILKGSQPRGRKNATQPRGIQNLMSKLLEDVRNISEKLSEYINYPRWNHPTFYDNDEDEYTIIYSKPKEITPDLSIEEPDNSLSMEDEHLDTIPATETDKVIKSSVENLVPIPSEFKGISEDTCDVPVCEHPSTFDALSNHSKILSDSNNDEDILQIQDIILREKLLNITRLVTNIESLTDNPTPDRVLKSSFSFPIPITDIKIIFSFLIEPDQGGLTGIVISDNSNNPLLELPESESFHFDLSFPRPPSRTTTDV
ncbi:hypothetical protein Tco_1392288 [Tanacetum coccineum]